MKRTIRLLRSLFLLTALVTLLGSTAGALSGDCDGNGRVSVNEVITAVRISLGEADHRDCPAADRNGDGRVSIDELITAVREALASTPRQQRAFVVTSNFTAGSYATVELDEPRAVTPSSSQRRIHRDAVARTRGGLVYVVNRLFGDNLQVLDPQDGFRTLFQCSTGNGTNPHDIAFASDDKAYITLYEESELLIVNPAPRPDCGDFILGTINLGQLADDDGIPDMDQMVVFGGRLYVSLQRLDIDTVLRLPAGPGVLAVVDIGSDTLVDSIELAGENPFSATKGLTVLGNDLFISSAGTIGALDGGLERVDLRSGESDGIVVSEADLGGDITDFALVNSRLAYAVVARPDFTTALLSFDPTTGRLVGTVTESDGFNLFDIEVNDRGELFLADRTPQHDGLWIYRAADGRALVDEPIDLGLAPFEIVFLP